jgi:hypothetical protein
MKQALCLCSIFLLFCMTLPLAVHAGELREIVLIDGSVIVGELVSLTNGVYTIKTATLGDLKVEDARIKTIRNTSGGMAGPVKASGQQEIMAIQQDMIADGSIIQLILALQSDPDFQEALQDESIMMAINSGDLNALMTNPKIVKLMEKSSVQEIKRKLE